LITLSLKNNNNKNLFDNKSNTFVKIEQEIFDPQNSILKYNRNRITYTRRKSRNKKAKNTTKYKIKFNFYKYRVTRDLARFIFYYY
jgi:hypothetical protein